jgi:hypothetical protein
LIPVLHNVICRHRRRSAPSPPHQRWRRPATHRRQASSSRRFKELAETFTCEFGSNLSAIDQSQVQQLVTLTMTGEQMSADVAGGKPVDADTLIRINSEARRLM